MTLLLVAIASLTLTSLATPVLLKHVNPLRRAVLPAVEAIAARWGVDTVVSANPDAHVATVTLPLEDLHAFLKEEGFRRYPLASLVVTSDGRPEVASWARHRPVWSTRQLHVRVFPARNGHGFDLYAHTEYTAHNPLYMMRHYRREDIRFREGVTAMRRLLEASNVPVE